MRLSKWSEYEAAVLHRWRRSIQRQAIAKGSALEVVAARLVMQCDLTEDSELTDFDTVQRIFRFARRPCSQVEFYDALSLVDAALRGSRAADAKVEFSKLIGETAELQTDFYVRRVRHALGVTLPNEIRLHIRSLAAEVADKTIDIPAFSVVTPDGKRALSNFANSVPVRSQSWTEIDGLNVLGTGILFDEDAMLLNDPAGDPSRGFIAGWWPHLSSHASSHDSVTLHSVPGVVERRLETAVIGATRCGANYWHNLIEYIPAIVRAVDESGCHVVLWRSDTPATATEALLKCREVELVNVDSSARVYVERAIIPIFASCSGESPVRPFAEHCGFDVSAVQRTYSALSSVNSRSVSMPKHVLLLRGEALSRPTKNVQNLIDAAAEDGFTALNPGDLSLDDQIQLFHTAQQIVGFGGASWANLLFSNRYLRVANIVSEPMSLYLVHRYVAHSLNLSLETFVVSASRSPHSYEGFMHYMSTGLDLDSRLWSRIRRSW